MIIHILTHARPHNPDSALTKSLDLLTHAAERLGHAIEIVEAKKCKLKFYKETKILIENKKPRIDVLVVKATFSGNMIDAHAPLVRQFELAGIPVVNRYQPIVRASNKILTLQTLHQKGIPMPKTFVVRSAEYIEDVMKDIGSYPVILKTASGSSGIGVSIIESKRGLQSIIQLLSEQENAAPIIIQEYVKESRGKDIRVFIVGGAIIAAMERVATQKGEFRSNFSLGGKVKIASLSEKEKSISLRAAEACGLDFAGVDVMRTKTGPKIIEVNSNPGLEGITQATGVDVAGAIIAYAVKKAKKRYSEARKT
ncbi:MAG: hypothetical protein A3G08_01040 [Candidatus Magasanikbacteria bacterium RIFCSPLOWO2_12_FULL_47_9b]|nr:MAG: hypothetical protein A3I74_03025 [Candidatus Magasanikbacteria bacterium RIFCSPLOWO2_02_FULL_47_16]OGH79538.1 MAG: hypothetical protein A3C10_00380 [Candidatus Magasanikbacteria bacterium RIFCSPHIGHO2_02_FULL_48_18]OGH83402.1 MAG: hypothetical protein A3G08_01040 [Candidatus Magasanikbacteria bacterium RIFCSPLOWO2_12_FULL_47_9b]